MPKTLYVLRMMTHDPQPADERPARDAMARGWKRTCPNCGTGKMFDGYLTVQTSCDDCGQELHHQRADDGPAYIIILVGVHLFGISMLTTYELFRPSPAMLIIPFSVAFIAFALYFLPRVKGALIGLQWAKRMHGFGKSA